MPPKRTRANKTKKKPSISDIFDVYYSQEDNTGVEENDFTFSFPSVTVPPVENLNHSITNGTLNGDDKKEKLNGKAGDSLDFINEYDSNKLSSVNEIQNSNQSSILGSQISNINGSTQSFIDSLVSSSLFPRPQLEEDMIVYMKTGKKRDFWDREVDNLREKIDLYKSDSNNESLFSEIIGIIHELNLDGNVSSLANFFGKDINEILSQIEKRKRIKTEIKSQDKINHDISDDDLNTIDNALDYLFIQKNNIFYTLPKIQTDSMIVTLQFLIFNNEFIIRYGNQIQICHFNIITRSFLQEIASGILPSGLMESLETLPQVKYYNGSILVEIRDHRSKLTLKNSDSQSTSNINSRNKLNLPPSKIVKLLLTPIPSVAFEHVKKYIDETCPNASEEEKLDALKSFLVTLNPNLELEPDTSILYKNNYIHYNKKKHIFRRLITRTISRTLMPSNPAQSSMTIQSSMMRTRKQDHVILNYIANNGWKKDKLSDIRAKPRGSVQPSPDFMKKLQNEIEEGKKYLNAPSPIHLLQDTMDISREHRKVVRILQFQAVQTNDSKRRWQIEVFPAQKGRRYDCVLIPSAEPIPRWTIGSKHAADLYCDRLKDMFTSNGKTHCSVDMEMDYAQWEEKRKPQQPHNNMPQATPPQNSTMPPANTQQITPTSSDRPNKPQLGPSPQNQSYVQIKNGIRVQNGQMQNLPFIQNMQVPPNQGLQGNIHAQQLHQVINQQQRKGQQ